MRLMLSSRDDKSRSEMASVYTSSVITGLSASVRVIQLWTHLGWSRVSQGLSVTSTTRIWLTMLTCRPSGFDLNLNGISRDVRAEAAEADLVGVIWKEE